MCKIKIQYAQKLVSSLTNCHVMQMRQCSYKHITILNSIQCLPRMGIVFSKNSQHECAFLAWLKCCWYNYISSFREIKVLKNAPRVGVGD